MMKKIGLYIGVLLFCCCVGAFAQGNEIDAYTLTAPELNGSARYMSMGGAFGALGGDLSVMSHNPAGLGIYRSSEISGTLDLSTINTSTNWSGLKTDMNKTTFGMSNFGFEFYFPTNTGAIRNWNIGFTYNRLKNFNRNYRMRSDGQNSSMADYVASLATNAKGGKDGYTLSELGSDYNSLDVDAWMASLGYKSGFFDHMTGGNNVYQSSFGYWSDNSQSEWKAESPNSTYLDVSESGHIDEYNFALGTNVSNFLFFGASLSVTDISYKYHSSYKETFEYSSTADDFLSLENWSNTEGSAVSINLGAIINLQSVRLGVAYNSPRWYNMTDYFDATGKSYIHGYSQPEASSSTPLRSYTEYCFRTPGRWIFSGALILGQSALISADYELMDYSKMNYSDRDGADFYTSDFIKEDYALSHTFRIGAEVKITPQFAIRGGYMMQTSPMKSVLTDTYTSSNVTNSIEIFPSGTIPHYTVTKDPINSYSVGFGYRFTPNIYMDLACVYRSQNSDSYAFSNMPYEDSSNGIKPVVSVPASLKTKTTRMVLTLGYKF